MRRRFFQKEIDAVCENARRIFARRDTVPATLAALAREATRLSGADEGRIFAGLDLDADVREVAEQIEYILREIPPPEGMTHLFVGCYFVTPHEEEEFVACHVSGTDDFRGVDEDGLFDTSWSPSCFQIVSQTLERIRARINSPDGDGRGLGWSLLHPAMGLIFRAAVDRLGLPYTVVVTIGDAEPILFVLESAEISPA